MTGGVGPVTDDTLNGRVVRERMALPFFCAVEERSEMSNEPQTVEQTPPLPSSPETMLYTQTSGDDEIMDGFAEILVEETESPVPPPPEDITTTDTTPVEEPQSVEEPKEPEDTTAPGEDVAEEFPGELLAEAGLTLEEAKKQFRSAESLEDAIKWQTANLANAGRRSIPQQAESATPQQPPQQPAQQPAQQPVQQDEPFEVPKDQHGNPLFDDETNAALEQLDKRWRQSTGQLKQQLDVQQRILMDRLQQEQLEAQTRYVDEFDRVVNSWGDDWSEVFGKGSRDEVMSNAQAMESRRRLNTEASIIARGAQQMGLPVPSTEQLLLRARRQAFAEQQEKLATSGTQQALRNRQKMVTSRPTHRVQRSGSTDQRLLDAVDATLKKKGHPGLDYGPDNEPIEF